MVRIKLENNLPNITGLGNGEKPLHLLKDSEDVFYLVTHNDDLKDIILGRGKVYIGKENEEMKPAGQVASVMSMRDGGTTIIDFLDGSEKGHIYVPSSLHKGEKSTFDFKGETKKLSKFGYERAYF